LEEQVIEKRGSSIPTKENSLDTVGTASGGTLAITPKPSLGKRIWKWIWRAALICLLLPVVQVFILKFINPPFTTMMFYQSMEHLFSGERVTWSHTNLSLSESSSSLFSAVVAGEDQRFFSHNGFDFVEIEKAQKAHERNPKKPLRGASTISQQVAKNLFLPPWRSFIRKGIEAYYTILIEWMWPKERILQMYSNVVEFAPNVYGAEEGALFHFKKHAKSLTPAQASLMAAVLPNPERWSASKPSAYIKRRAARIQRQMQGLPASEDEDGDPD